MFRVHRQDRHLMLGGQLHDQLAGHDQSFLIRQGDRLSRLDRRDRRSQAGITHHRRQHHIDRLRLHHLGDSVGTRPYLDRQVLQGLFQLGIFPLVGDHHHLRHIFPGLIDQ